MKIYKSLAWISFALLVALLPTRGWAYADPTPTEERTKKLQKKAKDLADTCASDVGKTDKAKDLSQTLRKEIINTIKAAMRNVEADKDAKAEDKAKATEAVKALDASPPDIEGAIKAAGGISSILPAYIDDWKQQSKITKPESMTQRVESACTSYCTTPDGIASHINICDFSDINLARVASAVDPASVEVVLASIDSIEKYGVQGRGDRSGGSATAFSLGLPALTTAGGVTKLAIRLATALGKLAIDRAKQEAVLWALGEVGNRFCGNDAPNDPARAEIRTYWLPQLCRLATEENLQSGFGAGQAMLSALVSAIEEDAKHMPGAAAGLIVGLAYWSEDTGSIDDMSAAFDCAVPTISTTKDGGECDRATAARLAAVRSSTADTIDGLLEGKDPIDAARSWSEAIDETNRVPLIQEDPSKGYILEAPLAQLTACGVALAAELSADADQRMVLAPEGKPIPERYQVVAILASSPACWTISGKGWLSADVSSTDKGCGPDKGNDCLALDRTNQASIERLSTVIRLHESLQNSEFQTRDAWAKLLKVVRRLQGARKGFEKAVDDTKDSSTGKTTEATLAAIAKLDPTKLELNDLRALLDEAKLDHVKDRLSTALDVAEELLATTGAAALLLEAHSDQAKLKGLFPGLMVKTSDDARNFPGWVSTPKVIHDSVKAFRAKLADVQELIDALREILAGDWATGTTKALAAAQQLFPRKAKHATANTIHDDLAKVIARLEEEKEKSSQGQNATKALDSEVRSLKQVKRRFTQRRLTRLDNNDDVTVQLGELIGLITAILSAKDSDDIAVVLEKTASPPGSWRRKQAPGSFTLSLGSHVGVYAAAELRWGQYGVNRERGTLHGQAPTLAVPIGFDFAWGTGRSSLGFFVPLIDPAAFVQYDVSENGRLPGPRPLTVLSPGAFFRWGICRTPLTLLFGYTYRPRLRTWEATINEPGADAHQIGLSLAIDATFWNIVKR